MTKKAKKIPPRPAKPIPAKARSKTSSKTRSRLRVSVPEDDPEDVKDDIEDDADAEEDDDADEPSSTASLFQRVGELEGEVESLWERVKALPEAPEEDNAPSLAEQFEELKTLVLGAMTTKIRQTERRIGAVEEGVKIFEERLDDCEGFLLEALPAEGDKTDDSVAGS